MLPAPHLDDRTFQDLVDEAKRLVQQRCPTWTDHNVSDPGVTLLEAVAQMVDTLLYRLNRVPDRNYVKFLEMIGVELRSPAAARGAVTFWLSAPQPQAVLVRAETEVATPRTDIHPPVVFTTLADLSILPCSFSRCATQTEGGDAVETSARLGGRGFTCFADEPAPGDSLLIGLSDAVPSCAVLLRLDCSVAGIGVDPRRPPLVWEAWTGAAWTECEVDRDETGGFNQSGDVVLHVPRGHRASIVARQRAGWLRCRLLAAEPDEPTYTASPRIMSVTAHTVGGTTSAIHAEVVRREELGRSDGTPGQRISLQRRPVVSSDEPVVIEVDNDGVTTTWSEVAHFADSGPQDQHFRLDAHAGEVQFGPAVRLPGGGLVYYGAVPPLGARLRIEAYRTGGGREGNVAAGQVRVLKTSVPYIATVTNRAPAVGGAEAESLEDAKIRGPLLLRSRGRAVTAEDIEELAHDVAPEAARVHCVPASDTAGAGGIRILVVPHVASDELGRVRRSDLDPSPQVLQRIAEALDSRRLVGTRLLVTPPEYSWLTTVVSVSARPRFDPDEVRDEVLAALYRLFHPLVGGSQGSGWPFGRSIQAHEVVAALALVPGVDLAKEVEVALYPAEPGKGPTEQARARRLPQVQRLDLSEVTLAYSYEHQVRVR